MTEVSAEEELATRMGGSDDQADREICTLLENAH
jgi:hypothetical protein